MKLPRTPILIGVILLLAIGVRLIALDSRTLWYDEAFAVLFSEKGLNAMLYGTLTPSGGAAADVHPLLYYETLDGWVHLFGQSQAAVRLYSVLLGVATVGMIFVLARELFGDATALVAALIAALAPFEVQYSQETRMYALLGLLLITATWCFVLGWRTRRLAYWVAFGVLSGLSMYAQQLAAFYLIALGLVPVIVFLAPLSPNPFPPRKRRERGTMPAIDRRQQFLQMMRTGLGAAIALIIYLPWLVNLPSQFAKLSTYWIKPPDIGQLYVTFWSFIFVELPVTSVLAVTISTLTLALLVIFLAYRALVTVRRYRPDYKPLLFCLWLAIAPIALMWLESQWRPVYLIRALLPSSLVLIIALAWLLTCARLPRVVLGIIVVPWVATILIGLYTHYTWATFPRPPFDAADQFIADRWQSGDRVVHASKITMLPMFYYNRSLAQRYIRDAPGSAEDTLALPTQQALGLVADNCVASAAQGARTWFVIFREQIEQQGGTSPDQIWLDAHYHRESVQAFNDLQVYLYDQPDAVAQRGLCDNKPGGDQS